MKNIERFNLVTAHVFGMLYEAFPVGRMVHEKEVIDALKDDLELGQGDDDRYLSRFFANTMLWLEETGYIHARGKGQDRKLVLTPKAFEAMAAPLPSALDQKAEGSSTVGEQLVDVASGVGREIGREARKQAASRLVGEIIGYAIKTVSGP